MKRKQIDVDYNLFHLETVLFDLDNYSFDIDIIKKLNDLKLLVDKKLYSSFDFENYNILDKTITLNYILESV